MKNLSLLIRLFTLLAFLELPVHAMTQQKSGINSKSAAEVVAVVPPQKFIFTKSELEELEVCAKAYINVQQLAGENRSDVSGKFLNSECTRRLNRFFSFFKNKKQFLYQDFLMLHAYAKMQVLGMYAIQVINMIVEKNKMPSEAEIKECGQESLKFEKLHILIDAICSGDTNQVGDLLKARIDLAQFDENGNTPLFYAVALGAREIIAQLIESVIDGDPKAQVEKRIALVNMSNEAGLCVALLAHDQQTKKFLVRYGLNINAKDVSKQTPLRKAIAKCDKESLEIGLALLAQKADISLDDADLALRKIKSEVTTCDRSLLPLFAKLKKNIDIAAGAQKEKNAAAEMGAQCYKSQLDSVSAIHRVKQAGLQISACVMSEIKSSHELAIAVEAFKLTAEENEELELLAQAVSNMLKLSKVMEMCQQNAPPSLAMISEQILHKLYAFFNKRGIFYAKLRLPGVLNHLKNKVGVKAQQVLKDLSETLEKAVQRFGIAALVKEKLIVNESRDHALSIAAFVQDEKRVQELLRTVNPNVLDARELSPIYYAILSAHADPEKADRIIQMLLNSGADIKTANSLGIMPMFFVQKNMGLKNAYLLKAAIPAGNLAIAIQTSRTLGTFFVECMIEAGVTITNADIELADYLVSIDKNNDCYRNIKATQEFLKKHFAIQQDLKAQQARTEKKQQEENEKAAKKEAKKARDAVKKAKRIAQLEEDRKRLKEKDRKESASCSALQPVNSAAQAQMAVASELRDRALHVDAVVFDKNHNLQEHNNKTNKEQSAATPTLFSTHHCPLVERQYQYSRPTNPFLSHYSGQLDRQKKELARVIEEKAKKEQALKKQKIADNLNKVRNTGRIIGRLIMIKRQQTIAREKAKEEEERRRQEAAKKKDEERQQMKNGLEKFRQAEATEKARQEQAKHELELYSFVQAHKPRYVGSLADKLPASRVPSYLDPLLTSVNANARWKQDHDDRIARGELCRVCTVGKEDVESDDLTNDELDTIMAYQEQYQAEQLLKQKSLN